MNLQEKGFHWIPVSKVLEVAPKVSSGDPVDEFLPGPLGAWCLWYVVMGLITQKLQDTIVVQHGPNGCNSAARTFFIEHVGSSYGMGFPHIVSTDMAQGEVVLGGEDKLRSVIVQADRDYKPSLIIVHTNCASGLNMDDVQGVIQSVQGEVKAKLHFIPTPGFCSCYPGEQMHMALPQFVDLMEPPKNVNPRAVNLIGVVKEVAVIRGKHGEWIPKIPQDSNPYVNYIQKLGLTFHRGVIGGTYDYLKTAPEAAVNVIQCNAWGYPVGEAMLKKFGTPYLKHGMCIGVDATVKWIKDLANFMNVQKEGDRLIDEEYAQVKDIMKKAKEMVTGKIALISGGRNTFNTVTRALGLARFAIELGMTPYIFNMGPMHTALKPEVVKYFAGEGCDPKYLLGPYAWQSAIDIQDIMNNLGVGTGDVVYFPGDVFNYAKAGEFDPGNTPRLDVGQSFGRVRNAPRSAGIKAAGSMARGIIDAVNASKRNSQWTLYGRMFGSKVKFMETA